MTSDVTRKINNQTHTHKKPIKHKGSDRNKREDAKTHNNHSCQKSASIEEATSMCQLSLHNNQVTEIT